MPICEARAALQIFNLVEELCKLDDSQVVRRQCVDVPTEHRIFFKNSEDTRKPHIFYKREPVRDDSERTKTTPSLWKYFNSMDRETPLVISKLSIFNFDITTFPKCILSLSCLTELTFQNTGVVHIPSAIEYLINLEALCLNYRGDHDDEEFTYKPPKSLTASRNIGKLTKLRRILLCSESLETIPREFGLIPNLHTLNVALCPRLRCVPKSIACRIVSMVNMLTHFYGSSDTATELALLYNSAALRSPAGVVGKTQFPSLKEAVARFILKRTSFRIW